MAGLARVSVSLEEELLQQFDFGAEIRARVFEDCEPGPSVLDMRTV